MTNINVHRSLHVQNILLLIIIGFQFTVQGSSAWGGDRVLLSDIKVLTLHHGKMTTARRSSPVPQLNCISGTAGCSTFIPNVVQCHNQGSDGNDIQWECKTDMDNAYRFGNVEVTCEGYDYPDDPYVLKGSCGLEYTIDFTKEGHQSKQSHSYYGQYDGYSYSKEKSGIGSLIMLAIVCLIGYAIYKTCISNYQYSSGNDDYPGSDHRYGSGTFGPSSSGPPPPGFRPEYTPGGGCSAGSGTYNAGTGTGGGGFWTGAATGGLLGYLLGNNRGQTVYNQRPGYGGGLFGGGGSSGYSFGGGGGGSSGTRTASGFGGTRRR